MKIKFLTSAGLLASLAFSPLSSLAAVPAGTMDQLYNNCMGTDHDPEHAAFCSCVRDGMKDWSEDDYNAVVAEAQDNAHKGGAAGPPAKVEEIAKVCIAKVFH